KPNTPRLAILAILLGAVSIALGLAPVLPVAWVLMPLVGGVGIAFAITGNATLQLTSSDEMRGRVMALYGVIFLGSTPIGGPIAGLVGQHGGSPVLGPRIGLVAGGVVAVAAGLVALAAVSGKRASRSTVTL